MSVVMLVRNAFVRSGGDSSISLAFILLPSAPCKDLEQLVMRSILLMSLQRLDVRLLEQLRKDVGIGCRSCLSDEVGSGARRSGGFGQREEGRKCVECERLVHCWYAWRNLGLFLGIKEGKVKFKCKADARVIVELNRRSPKSWHA